MMPALPLPAAWTEQAVCASVDPELWFPEKGGSTKEAKQLCFSCPVRTECLQDALDRGERYGIWGGLSERELSKIRRLRRAGKEAAAA